MPAPVTKLTKSDIDSAKNVNPMGFLKGQEDIEEPVIENKQENPPPSNQHTPAKQLKDQLEKVKRDRDELSKKLEEYEQNKNQLSDLEPLRPVAEYLKSKAGKVDEETVKNELIEKNRNRKKALQEKEEALKLKDQKIKEISIDQSEEWHEEYLKPINQSREILETSIFNIDDDGKVRHPELMKDLFSRLVSVDKDGKSKTSLEIKAEIKKFATEYERVTGLEYEMPSLKEVVDSVSKFHGSIMNATKARQDWESVREQKKKERIFEEAKEKEKYTQKEIQGRDYLFNEYITSVDSDSLKEVLDSPEEFISAAKEEHTYLRDALMGKPDLRKRDYNEFIDLAAKGKLFNKLVEKVKSLQQQIKEFNDDSKPPKFRGGVDMSKQQKNGGIVPGANYNPTGFLK